MNYKVHDNEIILYQPDFDLDETLDCGQAFRWEKVQSEYDCTYSGYFLDRPLTISHDGDRFILHNTSEEDFPKSYVSSQSAYYQALQVHHRCLTVSSSLN